MINISMQEIEDALVSSNIRKSKLHKAMEAIKKKEKDNKAINRNIEYLLPDVKTDPKNHHTTQ